MQLLLDGKGLRSLLASLEAIGGIRAGVRDLQGRELCAGSDPAEFCALACGPAKCSLFAAGREKVTPGTAQAAQRGTTFPCCAGRAEAGDDAAFASCPAGACLLLCPIRCGMQGATLCRLVVGPFRLAGGAPEAGLQAGHPAEGEQFSRAFRRLRALSPAEQDALRVLAEAISEAIGAGRLVQVAVEADARRLEAFLDAHYREKLTLADVSARLHIGRTRLCALAKELSDGQTLTALLGQRRIDAAKAQLVQTNRPVSAIAEAVGISDYNYFSKIFRRAVGCSPSEFRKRARSGRESAQCP